jgi:hypothetical protein
MTGDICTVEWADVAGAVEIPDRGLRCSGNDRGTVRGQKRLRRLELKLLNQSALAVGFEPAFNFIDDGYGAGFLILFRDGERSETARSGSPAR